MAQTRFHLPTTMERVNNHKTICLRLLKEMEKTISNSTVNTIVSSTTERRLEFTSPLPPYQNPRGMQTQGWKISKKLIRLSHRLTVALQRKMQWYDQNGDGVEVLACAEEG